MSSRTIATQAKKATTSSAPPSLGVIHGPSPVVELNDNSIPAHSEQVSARPDFSWLQTFGGGSAACVAPGDIQTKLAVSQPGDRLEQEADHVADEVMRGPLTPGSIAGSRPPRTSRGASALRQALRSGGQPLGHMDREFMERRFNHDFGDVRVHTDSRSASMAGGLKARAFTLGQDIVFGSGQYVSGSAEGKRLLAHELAHTIQQQAGMARSTLQLDVIDDVREKMSYSIIDWAITDAEALESLALLGTIPPANLANELKRLEQKYVTRLLDNLPDAAKTGEIYTRLIGALGPGGVLPYAKDQLSYCFFSDWMITDAEVTRVFNIFTTLPATSQEQFLADLNKVKRLGRLIDNSNTGHHALYIRPWMKTLVKGAITQQQKDILHQIAAESSDAAIETLQLATEIRFNVSVGPSTIPGRPPVDWDADHLRRTYLALDKLPEAHVAKNKELLHLGQFKQPGKVETTGSTTSTSTVEGTYNEGSHELAINIEASGDIEDSIIHETGHAVDAEMGWSDGPDPATPARGEWKHYGVKYHDCAVDMIDDSAGGIKTKLSAGQQGDVIREMATSMRQQNAQGLEGTIKKLPWFNTLKAPAKSSVLDDKALSAIEIALQKNTPWLKATDGGEHLGRHVYEEGYPHAWERYGHEALTRKVSQYQFRARSEWFAEAYSYYYQPDRRGKGAKLNDKDSNTKTYFDNNVDTRTPSR